jgi:hypothetical protein
MENTNAHVAPKSPERFKYSQILEFTMFEGASSGSGSDSGSGSVEEVDEKQKR